jgi:hypothetical protein
METDYVRNAWACIERVIVTAIRGHERNHEGRDPGGKAVRARRVIDRRDCQRNIYRRAIFAHANRFEMVSAQASPELLKNHRLLISVIGRNYKCDVLAYSFLSGIAK